MTYSKYGLRPEVLAFAHLMERHLRANDDKPGWKSDSAFDLNRRLFEEWDELSHALVFAPDQVGREAADVANFAMMIADVCGALPSPTIPSGLEAATASRTDNSRYLSLNLLRKDGSRESFRVSVGFAGALAAEIHGAIVNLAPVHQSLVGAEIGSDTA